MQQQQEGLDIIRAKGQFTPIQQSEEMKRITRFLRVPEVRTRLPPPLPEDEGKITVFCDLDEILCFTFLPDENMGSITNPAVREADHMVFIE